MRYVQLLILLVFIVPIQVHAQIGNCEEAQARALLDVGNVRAAIYNDGALFWKGGQNVYTVPKDSAANAIFTSNIWIAGKIDGELRMAASTFGNYEFWPGPLDEQGAPPADCTVYDQIWEMRAQDFELHNSDSVFSANLLNWPWELGAPVIDGDGNPNNYNLEGGDLPEMHGDQMLWWVMNDRGNEHLYSKTPAIGLEAHVTAYAFANPRISDITFYRYHIINKNTSPLTEAFVAMFVDADLGNASDDYVGSDSLLHLAYTYNGDPDDENGYGIFPPAIGYTFLITPEASLDAYDNDRDGQVDEPGEMISTYGAMYYQSGGGIVGDPANALETFNYMKSKWIDGKPLTEGGDGRTYSSIPARFAFSGDPSTRSFWSEVQPGSNNDLAPNPAADRRFVLTSGPMTLAPRDTSEFLIAIAWAQGEDYLDSVRELKGIVKTLQNSPRSFLGPGFIPRLIEPGFTPQFVLGFDQNFPNPFSNITTLRYSLPKTMQVRLTIFDMLGRKVETLTAGTQEEGIYSVDFDGSKLPAGIYYARIGMDHLSFTKKMVLIP